MAATLARPASSKSARTATRHPAEASRAIAPISSVDGVPEVQSKRTSAPSAARSAAAEATDGFSMANTHLPGSLGAGQGQVARTRGGSVTGVPGGSLHPSGTMPTAMRPPVRSSQSTPIWSQAWRGRWRCRGWTAPAATSTARTNPAKRVPSSSAWGLPVASKASCSSCRHALATVHRLLRRGTNKAGPRACLHRQEPHTAVAGLSAVADAVWTTSRTEPPIPGKRLESRGPLTRATSLTTTIAFVNMCSILYLTLDGNMDRLAGIPRRNARERAVREPDRDCRARLSHRQWLSCHKTIH